MSDTILLAADAGAAIRRYRLAKGMSMVDLARLAGRSRDTLHRLEAGEDVSMSTFLAFAHVLGCGVALAPTGLPSMREMTRRFAADDDDDA